MNKQELITKIEGKVGFKAIVDDSLAPDSPKITDINKVEKRFFQVATENADGTAGITFVFYLHDKETDEAWFYNAEAEVLDLKELTAEQKRFDSIEKYLRKNFHSYFIYAHNMQINTVFAEVYIETEGKLTIKKVVAFKRGADPVTHLEVIE